MILHHGYLRDQGRHDQRGDHRGGAVLHLSIASFAVGIIAMSNVAPEMLHRVVPAGWDNVFFGWHLNLDWSTLLPAASDKIAHDGYGLFGFFVDDAALQGHSDLGGRAGAELRHAARALGQESARGLNDERVGQHRAHLPALLSGHRTYGAGRRVLWSDSIRAMGTNMDFELVLPYALGRFVPVGLLGFLIAGLLAAFMSNFAATVNAAPPYFVNDIYKRYINPNARPRPMSG